MNAGAEALAAPLTAAMHELRAALLQHDPARVETAARAVETQLRTLERNGRLTAETLEQLATLNRENGALLAARQAAVHWALTRLGRAPALYDRGGHHPSTPASRRLASA